ncbi:MAG: M20/M25/M40 family metallo-hydrolase [Bacteriovoracaceae bacterium]|jgi:glutamate carboxypeptidase|nr:M20/M25/M40 family metallo-hydrolase [Bacteriovoracaceae bacterium]
MQLQTNELSLDFLEKVVNIDSRSNNKDGVSLVQKNYLSYLRQLGLSTQFVKNDVCDSADLLLGSIRGNSHFKLNLICHADTVIGPSSNEFRYSDCAKFLYGAGIADNKSGALIAMLGLEYYLNKVSKNKLNINFISSPNEELGSIGFHNVFKKLGQEAVLSLGFEPSMPDGSLIHSRNGNRWYKLHIKGQAYHSGRAKKGHMNAAHDLCSIISCIQTQMSLRQDVTCNVGQIIGGHSFNTICNDIIAKIDTRFNSFDGRLFIDKLFSEKYDEVLQECTTNNIKNDVSISIEDDCPPMPKTDLSNSYLYLYTQTLREISNISYSSVHCGGAADINHFCHDKGAFLDGLGAIGANMHRKDEYIEVDSIKTKSIALGEYLYSINEMI